MFGLVELSTYQPSNNILKCMTTRSSTAVYVAEQMKFGDRSQLIIITGIKTDK